MAVTGNTLASVSGNTADSNAAEKRTYPLAFAVMTSLFFMWGFITCLNDILIPHLKAVFNLNYTQAMLVQFCFFGAYFICSVPAGHLVRRIGYKRGVVVGLLVAAAGAALFYPAAALTQYSFFLAALFILASGVTLLQVAANPYVIVLGPYKTASSRLNLAQAFNSLGTTVAPFFGGLLLFTAAETTVVAGSMQAAAEAEAVKLPYLLIAGALLVLAIIIASCKLPEFAGEESPGDSREQGFVRVLRHAHLCFGVIAIFLYVGGEVAIGSFLVSFFGDPDIAGLTEAQAAKYVAYYWGGAMVGRFIGSVLMTRVEPGRLLGVHAILAVVLVAAAILTSGKTAMFVILAVGLCNSIMFPTIFSLALRDLGTETSAGSGALCLAIVGGAVIPLLQGVLADTIGLQPAFIVPLLCYLYITWYGLKGSVPADMVGVAEEKA